MDKNKSYLWLLSTYFILNLFVTVSSKRLEPYIQSAWLLTGSHACATLVFARLFSFIQIYTSVSEEQEIGDGKQDAEDAYHDRDTPLCHFRDRNTPLPDFREQFRTHYHILVPFGFLYTLNIVASNWTLGLVSLTMHQNIRATVPAITVLLSVTFLRKPWREYSPGIYGAVLLTTCGMMWASSAAHLPKSDGSSNSTTSRTSLFGFAWTLLGAILAVVKTICSNRLQRPQQHSRLGLNLPSWVLVRYCSLYAMYLTLLIAGWNGDFDRMLFNSEFQWMWLWMFNAFAAFLLNITSFEAAKQCGPLTMGIASNAKQVVILLLDLSAVSGYTDIAPEVEKGVVLGVLVTALGGVWYAFASAEMARKQRRSSTEQDNITMEKQV